MLAIVELCGYGGWERTRGTQYPIANATKQMVLANLTLLRLSIRRSFVRRPFYPNRNVQTKLKGFKQILPDLRRFDTVREAYGVRRLAGALRLPR